MATTSPRISVTVTPRVEAVLNRFSKITGRSKSAVVGEILDESYEVLAKMVKVMEAAQSVHMNMAAAVAQPFKDAHHHLEQQLGLVMDDLHNGTDDLLAEIEAVERRAVKAVAIARSAKPTASARGKTPPSNRGVRKLQVLDSIRSRKS